MLDLGGAADNWADLSGRIQKLEKKDNCDFKTSCSGQEAAAETRNQENQEDEEDQENQEKKEDQ